MTTNPPELQPEQTTHHQKEQTFKWLVPSLLFVALLLVGGYLWNFHTGIPSQERFGQFGDFFGGVLNPILGFATIGLLVWSLKAQREALAVSQRELATSNKQLAISNEELALTRNELKETKEEAALSRKAMQAQVKHLEKEAKLNELLRIMADLRAQFSTVTESTVSEKELFVKRLTESMAKVPVTKVAERADKLRSTSVYDFLYGNSSDLLAKAQEAKDELKRQYNDAVLMNESSQWRRLESILLQLAIAAMRYHEESISKDLTINYLLEAQDLLRPFEQIFKSKSIAEAIGFIQLKISAQQPFDN